MKSVHLAGIGMLCGVAVNALAAAPDSQAVLSHYADIALAVYEDSLDQARELDAVIDAFLESPDEASFAATKAQWLAARVPYQQSEVYRFGNPIVDAWEGRVNAWPLDEGLIDYVNAGYGSESDENPLYTANVIASQRLDLGGQSIDATEITPELLEGSLQEAAGVEANVASGYHAIEFLLWGQDLHGTGAGAGERPYTDYATENCSGGNCERRAQYLRAASALLITDLEEMVAHWAPGGTARQTLLEGDATAGIATMLMGMGSLSSGELAGERMQLGLMLHDPEEEHDCFSDNTHNSHYYDALGIQNVYLGRYRRSDGSVVEGASLSQLVEARDPELDAELKQKLEATMTSMGALKERAESTERYDQMIGEGNEAGNATVQAAVDALIDQTRSIERVIVALDLGPIELEGSDSLDSPNAVFN